MTTTTTWGPVAVLQAMHDGALDELSSIERLVLLVVADFGRQHGECFAKLETIAKVAGCSQNTARRALHMLVARSLLVVGDRAALAKRLGTKLQETMIPYVVALPNLGVQNLGVQSLDLQNDVFGSPKSGGPGPSDLGGRSTLSGSSERSTKNAHAQRRVGSGVCKGASPKKPKPEREPHPRHREVVDHYWSAFEAKRGSAPADGGRVAKDVASLLVRLDADDVLRRIDNMLADASSFGLSQTIHSLAKNPDAFAVRKPTPRSTAPTLQRDPPGARSWANEVE